MNVFESRCGVGGQMVELLAIFGRGPLRAVGAGPILMTDAPGQAGRAAGRCDADDAEWAGGCRRPPWATRGMKPAGKTNAVRLLDGLGISYELRPYEVDLDDLTAVSVAKRSGCLPSRSSRRAGARRTPVAMCLGSSRGMRSWILKKLAVGGWSEEDGACFAQEVEPLTGYVRGGVTGDGREEALPCLCG